MPFSETVCDILSSGKNRGCIVIEISSFMSYGIGINPVFSHEKSTRKECFHTDYSIFTNFERDHQNWHTDMQEYLDAKMSLIHHTTRAVVVNSQILTRTQELNLTCKFPENTRFIGREGNDRTDGENIIISGRKKYKLSDTHFSGFHNAMNILACTVVTNSLRICSKRTK
jgi:UDP-N-acetylmuramoylalanine-D-glutamate ligase